MWFITVFCALLVSAQSLATIKIPRKDLTHPVSLVGGSEDVEDTFSSVLVFSHEDRQLSSRCSGTKIEKNKFVTAAHCFIEVEGGKLVYWPKDSERLTRTIYFSFEPKILKTTLVNSVQVKKINYHPFLSECFNQDESTISNCIEAAPDLAVVEVADSSEFMASPSAPMDVQPVQVGDTISMVGYGYEKENDSSRPKRKYHSTQVVSHDALKAVFMEAADEDTSIDDELYFGAFGNSLNDAFANLGSGDSGGAVFRKYQGIDYLVGVNSFTFCPNNNSNCEASTSSFFARIHRGGKYFLGNWLLSFLLSF